MKRRILWLCNKAPSLIENMRHAGKDSFGGWLDTTLEQLASCEEYGVGVLVPSDCEDNGNSGNICFWTYNEKNCCDVFAHVLSEYCPDIIHIWGTEFSHSFRMIEACKQVGLLDRCVISIQGLVSIYGKYHYCEGVPYHVVNRYTLRDCIKHDNIYCQREKFLQRGEYEIKALKMVPHVIGRTDWDCAIAKQLNPGVQYHFCNETLRETFYHKQWDVTKIERDSIFVSQCSYPIKGFHYLLMAMPEIIKRHPNARIYTTGKDLLNLNWKDRFKITSYQLYICELIKQYHLEEKISFLGQLSAEQMCDQYLKANVFVSASTIENSPNSVGEAMLVGCPVVTSDVGGVKNMLQHGEEGFVYQTSAPYMLAHYVNQIFENDALAQRFSKNATEHAKETHDMERNYKCLLKIYKSIIEQ